MNPIFLDRHLYSARVGRRYSQIVVGSEKQFDRRLLDGMEYLIEGKIDEEGGRLQKPLAFRGDR